MSFQDFIHAILPGGPWTLTIFCMLVVMTIWSWGIIVYKIRQLSIEDKKDGTFVRAFNNAQDLNQFYVEQTNRGFIDFDLGMVFLESLKVVEQFRTRFPNLNFFEASHQDIKHNFDEMMGRTVQRVALQTSERRDTYLGILATTSNIAPFLGLLGTVIGIINAFTSIGESGAADLATVAPAISEALVATGMGIFVAIPSSAAFNLFQFRTQLLSQKFDRFAVIMQHRIQQQFMDPARS